MMKQIFNKNKPELALFFLFLLGFSPVFSQEIVTAGDYMKRVSEQYGTIRDYEANITIRTGNNEMIGIISYLAPSFLRIDFSRPVNQAIVFNGETLTVYIPELRSVLSQKINQSRRTGASGAGIASAQGLSMLSNNYVPSFVTGPNPEPLDENSRERVVKLRLTRRFVSEGFREIILSVNPDTRIIRRIEGRTIAEGDIRFDFTEIKTNLGIPEQRFIFDDPAASNRYDNFLFRDSD